MFLVGGNLHYQIYFETHNRRRVNEMFELIGAKCWFQQAYAPVAAENYVCKKDKTLVDGPWEWSDGTPRGQGKRTDMADIHKAIMGGETYRSLMRSGKWAGVVARNPKWIKEVEQIADGLKEAEPTWPIEIMGRTVRAPNELDGEGNANKKRHLWITGPPTTNKTKLVMLALKGVRKLYVPKAGGKTAWEHWEGQQIIVLDDCVMSGADLQQFTDVVDAIQHVTCRYSDVKIPANTFLQVIVINNKTIDEIGFTCPEAVKARFTVVKVGGYAHLAAAAAAAAAPVDDVYEAVDVDNV